MAGLEDDEAKTFARQESFHMHALCMQIFLFGMERAVAYLL